MSRETRDENPTDSRERARRKAEQDERQRMLTEREIADLRWVMGDERGRRFVRLLFDRGNRHRSCYAPHNGDMARLEGQRDFAIQTQGLLEQHCPDLFLRMEKERLDDIVGSRKPN